mmetsp:Transcript_14903/g.64501  ORF Transcript_14903/g.64501 Transcript_14903/m.64501 type:complete len:212 (+) Transcript_14903:257-892(+)
MHSSSALASAAAPSSPMEFLWRSSSATEAPSPRGNADAIAPAPASPRLLYPRSRRRRDGADARFEVSAIRLDVSATVAGDASVGWRRSDGGAPTRRLSGLRASPSPSSAAGVIRRRNPAPDSPMSFADRSRWQTRERGPPGTIIAVANADAPDTPSRVALRLRTSRLGLAPSTGPADAHASAMAAAPTAPRGFPCMNSSRSTGAPLTADGE